MSVTEKSGTQNRSWAKASALHIQHHPDDNSLSSSSSHFYPLSPARGFFCCEQNLKRIEELICENPSSSTRPTINHGMKTIPFLTFVCTHVPGASYVLTVWDGRAKTCAFKSKKALIKRAKQWGKGMAGIDTVKVLAGRQAAVSPGSFSNPGLLCLVCVCVCLRTHHWVGIRHNSRPYGFKPFCAIRVVNGLSHKHIVIVLCCCLLNSTSSEGITMGLRA